jgi:hypothetical protein
MNIQNLQALSVLIPALSVQDIIFLTNRVTTWWNRLPDDIVNAENLNIFKSKVHKWLNGNKIMAATAQRELY